MENKITSVKNPLIIEFSKLLQAKNRNSTGLFIVEGEKALIDIINSDIQIKNIFVLDTCSNIKDFPKEKIISVTEQVMKKLSSSNTPPKILTVAIQKKSDIQIFKNYNKLVLLDGISDPGNMGTIIRTAAAFDFDGILMSGNCVDIYNPKVIRSAAGNFFKIPFLKVSKNLLESEFKNYQFFMTDLHSDNVLQPKNIQLQNKFIFVLGSEANGISDEILQIPHQNIKINTKGVESLNVATAGAIIMYEISNNFK